MLRAECVSTWEFRHSLEEYFLFCSQSPDFEDFSFLTTKNKYFEVALIENRLINRDDPPLNKNKQPLPLKFFDNYRAKFHHIINRNIDQGCWNSFTLRGIPLSY